MSYIDKFVIHCKKAIFHIELRQIRPKGEVSIGLFYAQPEGAKSFMLALKNMVEEYEKQFGEIPVSEPMKPVTIGKEKESQWRGYV